MSRPIELRFTMGERNLILTIPDLPARLAQQMSFGVVENDVLIYRMKVNDIEQLCGYIADEGTNQPTQKRALPYAFLLQKIEDQTAGIYKANDEYDEDEEDDLEHLPPEVCELLESMPEELRREIEQILRGTTSRPADETQRMVMDALRRHAFNEPDYFDMLGLSTEQAVALCRSDWTSEKSVVRLNMSLTASDLKDVLMLNRAKTVLETVRDLGGCKATAKGNFNRETVKLLAALFLREDRMSFLLEKPHLFREEGIFELHVLRVVLSLGGLLLHRNGMWRVTKKGLKLLEEDSTGALYAHLFTTFFQKLNLDYLDGLPENPALQDTVAFSLHALSCKAESWSSLSDIADQILIPAAADLAHEPGYDSEIAHILLADMRVIRPLMLFGLLEGYNREDPSQPFVHDPEDLVVRKTKLFDKFLAFDFNQLGC